MIKDITHESTSVEDMRRFLGRLPSTLYTPNLFYDARFVQVKGDQRGDCPKEQAHVLAELTVQHNGSAYEDYRSISSAEVHKALMYVQARHMNEDFLIVGSQIDDQKRLVHPARLNLQDLIGFREIEKIE